MGVMVFTMQLCLNFYMGDFMYAATIYVETWP